MTKPLRSLLPWIGGKYYSARRILAAFPRLQATMPFGPMVSSTIVSCAQHLLQWEHLAVSTEVYPERNAWYVDEIVHLTGDTPGCLSAATSLP